MEPASDILNLIHLSGNEQRWLIPKSDNIDLKEQFEIKVASVLMIPLNFRIIVR